MAFADSVARADEACLRAFALPLTYTPQAGEAFTVRAILDTGVRQEDAAPGAYALLFVRAADFAEPPTWGDEVTVNSSVYKVVDLEADAEGGLRLVLHFKRTV